MKSLLVFYRMGWNANSTCNGFKVVCVIHDGFVVEVNKEASAYLEELGYSEKYGARPLQKEFKKKVIDEISKQILEGKLPEGTVQVGFNKDKKEVTFTLKEK